MNTQIHIHLTSQEEYNRAPGDEVEVTGTFWKEYRINGQTLVFFAPHELSDPADRASIHVNTHASREQSEKGWSTSWGGGKNRTFVNKGVRTTVFLD